MVDTSLLNINPFQTGRFKAEYTITNGNEVDWTNGCVFSEYEDCILENNSKKKREIGEKVLLCTVYEATDKDEKPVYISEYKRMLARKVDHVRYKENPNSALEDCGTEILGVITYLIDKYPLKKEYRFWVELQENTQNEVPVNLFDCRNFYPSNWDENVAPTIPILVLYVVDEVNPVKEEGYIKVFRNVSYETKKRLFTEGMKITYELLHYELFAELITPNTFLIRVNTSSELECVDSYHSLFILILRYVYNYDRCKKKSCKRTRNKLFLDSVPYIFGETMCSFLMELFDLESVEKTRETNDKREKLPPEMFMIHSRLEERRQPLKEKSLRNLIEELECPYEESKSQCFTKLSFLGSSTFGDVHLAEHKSSKVKYAIKVIRNYRQSIAETDKLLETLLLLVQLDNKHLMRYYDAWTSNEHYNWIVDSSVYDMEYETNSKISSNSEITFTTAKECLQEISTSATHVNCNVNHRYTFVVLEACEFSLYDKIKQSALSELDCIKYMKELLAGIQYLNIIGFMHRDIKPQNSLINKTGNLVISDLDTLRRIKDTTTEETTPRTLVQTPAYVSPEMLTKIYNERTDYFSAGITFAQMIYPEESKNMKKFLELIHAEQLPAIMHPQYAFVIRWLTEKDQKNRIGFLSFKILLSLLQKHQYKNWLLRVCSSYFVLVENTRIGAAMKCIRVVNRNSTIREVVRRYSRRPDSFVMKTKIRLRIEPKFAFESHYNLKFHDTTQKAIDLQDNSLTLVNVLDDYVYICYCFEEYKEESTSAVNFDYWVQSMLAIFLETMTTWGNYSCATINRAHFRKNHFVIEPSLLDNGSNDDIPSEITLFWAPEKFNKAETMTEAAAIYSFGLFILWNLLRNLDVNENKRINVIMELRKGNRLLQLPNGIKPHLSQLILLICAFNPQMRPSLQNLSHELIAITRPCVVDELFPFRLCLAFDQEKNFREDSEERFDTDNRSNKQYNPRRKLNEYIYTISNRNGVVEKFFNKLKICGRFKILPRLLATERHSMLAKSEFMLDYDENGLLVALPRNKDAVDWLVIEQGDSYPEIRLNTLALREYEFTYIYSTFTSALKELAKYHEEGLCHGNINLNTLLMSNNSNFCISNPILIETDNEFCDRKAYITEYSAAEQFSTGIASVFSDIYSLGVTLYSCLCYYYNQPVGNVNDIFRKENIALFSNKIPLKFISLVNEMTDLDPNRRLDCESALQRFLLVCGPHLAEMKVPSQRLVINNVIKDDDQLEIAK